MEFTERPDAAATAGQDPAADDAVPALDERTAELAREVLADPSLTGMPIRPDHERVVGDDLRVWTVALADPPSAEEVERVFQARATAHAALGLRCEEAVLQQHACATVLLHAMTGEAPGAAGPGPAPHVLRERALEALRIATAAVVRYYRTPAEDAADSCTDGPEHHPRPPASTSRTAHQACASHPVHPPHPTHPAHPNRSAHPAQHPTRTARPSHTSAPAGTARSCTTSRSAPAPRWCLAATQLGHGAKAALQRFRAANPQALIAVTGTNVTAFTHQHPNMPDVLGPYGVVAIEDGDTARAARRAALAAIVARHYGVRVDTRQALPLIAALDLPPEERETFVAACLGPLHTDVRHRYLLETLSTYLAHNLCVTAAARSLYVHRHTLTYRLRTIENLTGLDLGNAFDRMRAELTLILSRSSGWTVPRQRSA
ncbi:CdaR family transcriptional regulator [Streptomyces sp. DH12]|uniref:PucR family transcriptional regulator n=1 Tax=Streptomyces sp. DH12 TaxID=2857010 RepID=UPI001E54E2E0|nr:helix-turn-helix domain-containing protein [Streptomyces sp. DH12]